MGMKVAVGSLAWGGRVIGEVDYSGPAAEDQHRGGFVEEELAVTDLTALFSG